MSVEPALALAALAAGLAGAPHCLAMCGALGAGLCALGAPRPGPEALVVALRLHAGRVLGYALLGVLAGGLGASLAGGLALDPRWPRAAAGALLLLLGLGLLVPRLRLAASPAPLPVAERLMARLARLGRPPPLLLGLVWSLLPCGLSFGVLLTAVAGGSPVNGGLGMAAFGLGTALATFPPSLGLPLLLHRRRGRRLLLAALVLGAAIVTLAAPFWAPHPSADSPPTTVSLCRAP